MSQLFVSSLFTGFIILLGCTQKQPDNEAITAPASAPVKRASSVVMASSASPDDLVRALYKTHNAGKSPFFQSKDRALVDRFFVKEIADLIWDDAVISAQSGEVAFMDADPLYNAQDTDIKNFVIHPAEIDEDQAEVVVTFTNFGVKQELTFLLDKENGTWLISDLFYGDGSQLFQLLSGRAEETP